jgi:hypothetical protein
MARVPSYPFRCIVTKKPVGAAMPHTENHNYESLPGAWAYRDIALRRPNTKRVEIVMVLDESTPSHKE